MTADDLRASFLEFFKNKQHRIVESDSLVPKDDPTVLFTPAGMNQFKKDFLFPRPDFRRAASAQRCLRTDDLDKVGKTPVHHTFFEMLGNFSFGDYFKEEAIAWAWEFLTVELKIAPEKLWASVYLDDAEAYNAWRDKIKLPAEKIVKLGDKDNFWPAEARAKGPNGPCGPCSEIFFDFGAQAGCGKPDCRPGCSCARFAEVWNLVFTQFDRQPDASLKPLPKKNIDTGMGLERLSAVMQGVRNNFETDLFQPLVEEISSCVVRRASCVKEEEKKNIYAVADHLRAVVFAIYDGVMPSNEGRGYVLRKIIRKATLHLRAMGAQSAFFYKLVPVLAEIMRRPYPELKKIQENISGVILAEERNFISALANSPALFAEKFAAFKNNPDPESAGSAAFMLYDTYGIPLEVTRDWLNKEQIVFSQEAFDRGLSRQRERSQSQSAMRGDVFAASEGTAAGEESVFSGYEHTQGRARLIKIIKDGKEAAEISRHDEAALVLDRTPFYPESGGQVGDTGEIIAGKNSFAVTDTKRSGKAILHIGKAVRGAFKAGDKVLAKADAGRRLSVMRNHTATHLLQAALREVLGQHVRQQGSLVAPERLRFDFTHFQALSTEELKKIEDTVNGYIAGNKPVSAEEMPLEQAKKSGALAFFAEKYSGRVRVVSVGGVSQEFCGGTHLKNTGEVGRFKVIREGSVASGIRRIEACTAVYAEKFSAEQEENSKRLIRQSALQLKEKEASARRQQELFAQLRQEALQLVQSSAKAGGINIITLAKDGAGPDTLRRAVDLLRQQAERAVIALGGRDSASGKAYLVIGLTPDLKGAGLDAAELIRLACGAIGGSGGGRSDFAQGSGTQPENFSRAFEGLKEAISRKGSAK